jgi:high-affinity iron transporter
MTHHNFSRFKLLKTLAFWLTILILFYGNPAFAASESLEGKIKKIVMMLNIVAKEYTEGISPSGDILIAAEYEESQVFLDQAFERFNKLPAPPKSPEVVKIIKGQFVSMKKDIKSKVDPRNVRSLVSTINSSILEIYEIKINVSPVTPVSLANGKLIFEKNCWVCHGMTGQADGPLASQLDPAPAILADPNLTGDEHSVAYDNFQVINVGIANTGMVGWADILSEPEIWDVTYYVRSFSNKNVTIPLVSAGIISQGKNNTGSEQAKTTIIEVKSLLDLSLNTYKEKLVDDAADQAFDAYLAYEGIESGLIGKKKELGLRLESAFGRYRGEMKRGADIVQIEKINSSLHHDLDEALEVLTKETGFWGLFIQSFSIIVREGFEAILIIAALIAFLVKSRNEDKLKSIYIGVFLGIIGSLITAYVVHEILHITAANQEVMEGWIMLVAVVVLFWVSYWLVSKIEAEKWQSYITGKMKRAITTGSVFTLGAVAFLSVYREGFETVLFYKALYLYAGPSSAGIMPGFFAGCLVLAVVYYMINQLGVRIPIKWFFAFTSVFLYYMAFTFMGKGLHELQMGQQIAMTSIPGFPTISWMGVYPSWETVIGQGILVLAYVGALIYTFGIKPEVEIQTLKEETSNIHKGIAVVHDLVEHISHHAKRCEIFLKDTKDQDLKELSQHLKEIDEKVHELFHNVEFVENQLLDEYEKLGERGLTPERKKELP